MGNTMAKRKRSNKDLLKQVLNMLATNKKINVIIFFQEISLVYVVTMMVYVFSDVFVAWVLQVRRGEVVTK
jgi:hypothetical protein